MQKFLQKGYPAEARRKRKKKMVFDLSLELPSLACKVKTMKEKKFSHSGPVAEYFQ